MKTLKFALLIFFVGLFSSVHAQERVTKIIDLGSSPVEVKQKIGNNIFLDLMIENLLPTKKYTVKTEVTVKKIEPLPYINIEVPRTEELSDPTVTTLTDSLICLFPLTQKYNNLKDETEEKHISKLKTELKNELNKLDSSCKATTEFIAMENDIKRLLNSTSQKINEVAFANNNIVKITIERKNDDGETDNTWTIVYETEDRGIWLESYGISYISNLFKQNKTFIAGKDENNNSIVEATSNDRGNGAFVPAIFYTWLPYASQNSDFNFGLGGGLGFDVTNPVVMAGLDINYNWNFNIFLGAAYWKDKTPNPSYKLGQTISATDVDNLNKDKYILSPFLAFTFRIGSNPFGKKPESTPEESK